MEIPKLIDVEEASVLFTMVQLKMTLHTPSQSNDYSSTLLGI